MGTPEDLAQEHTPPPRSSLRDVTNGTEQPATPQPSTDAGINPSPYSPSPSDDAPLHDEEINVFTLKPVAALKLLGRTIDALVQATGDVPPTPPTNRSRSPSLLTMQAEKKEAVGHQLVDRQGHAGRRSHTPPPPRRRTPSSSSPSTDLADMPIPQTPIGSPSTAPHEPPHRPIISATAEALSIQHSAIARKFYSKRPPPIPLLDYLLRLHQYCPMSTAVYLATSLYIHKLAVVEQIVPVTGRNVHRLVLAGLRVAMKALEDLSYPHWRFAKVGGVSESELSRLEVGFCFLTNFELKVDEGMLWRRAVDMRDGGEGGVVRCEGGGRMMAKEEEDEVVVVVDGDGDGDGDGRKVETRFDLPIRPLPVPPTSS